MQVHFRLFYVAARVDGEVNAFRGACLRDGVPEEMLDDPKAWNIDPERVMGAGNKTVQMAIVQYLNSIRQNLGPDAQRRVAHDGILIMTEDAAMAEDLV